MQPVRVLTKKHIAATNISMLYRNKRKADRIVILQLVYTNAFSSRWMIRGCTSQALHKVLTICFLALWAFATMTRVDTADALGSGSNMQLRTYQNKYHDSRPPI